MRILITIVMIFGSSTLLGSQKAKLTDFKTNVYSQWGEDGIISKIFEIIGTTSKVAIEFGACDGFLFSNTANLWAAPNTEWRGILIESDPGYYNSLVSRMKDYPCIAIQKKVGITANDSLEAILENHQIDPEIDILSIDVDGDDYHIFQAISRLRPRVLIIEYNPSIPAHFDVFGNYGNHIGCSVAALQRLGSERGYSLISITDTNCIFVVNEEFPKFHEYETDRDHISIDRWISYVISDYSGQYKVIGASNHADPWFWSQRPSAETLNGQVTEIKAEVIKERTRFW